MRALEFGLRVALVLLVVMATTIALAYAAVWCAKG